MNEGFGLAGFKQIFWLEWFIGCGAGFIGLAFLAPLIWFWAAPARFERRLRPFLVLLFVLGGLQDAVGPFCVRFASGFFPKSTSVSPARLVIHLSARPGAVCRAAMDRADRAASHFPIGCPMAGWCTGWPGCAGTDRDYHRLLRFRRWSHAGFEYNTFHIGWTAE